MKALESNILFEYLVENKKTSIDIDSFNDSTSDSESFFLSNLVLNEVITTLEENSTFNRSDSLNALRALVFNSQIRFENRKVVSDAFEMYKKEQGSFSECLKSAVNQYYQAVDTVHNLKPSGTLAEF